MVADTTRRESREEQEWTQNVHKEQHTAMEKELDYKGSVTLEGVGELEII